MTKKQISPELFEYGKSGKERQYCFINSEGVETSATLSSADRLHKTSRCPRDGVRLIDYAGDPHRVIECPNCGYHPPTYGYSANADLDRLRNEQLDLQPRLARVNSLIAMLLDSNHPIKQKNLNDEAMLEK